MSVRLAASRSAFLTLALPGFLLALAGCAKETPKEPEVPAYVPEVVAIPAPPPGFEPVPEPPDNPSTPEKAALGLLFCGCSPGLWPLGQERKS